jgi:hypothetical protein
VNSESRRSRRRQRLVVGGLCQLRLVGTVHGILVVVGLYLLHEMAKLCNSTRDVYYRFVIRGMATVLGVVSSYIILRKHTGSFFPYDVFSFLRTGTVLVHAKSALRGILTTVIVF